MAIPLTINGAVFEYPVNFNEDWGVDATGWAQAVTNGMLQMQGGSFPLTADVNFGPNFGLLSKYFETRSSNPATIGTVRLSSADAGVAFRNFANSANLIITTDASDNLLYNGQIVALSGSGSGSNPVFTSVTVSNTGVILRDTQVSPNTVTVKAPATVPSSWVLKVPTDPGLTGQVLSTDGSGNTSWINAAGGGTINSGTANQLVFYPSTGTTVGPISDLTYNGTGLLVLERTSGTEFDMRSTGVGNDITFRMRGGNYTNQLYQDGTGNFKISDVTTSLDILTYNSASNILTLNRETVVPTPTNTTNPAQFGQVQYAFQQAVQGTTTTSTSTASTSYVATNLSASITPTSTSSRIKITISGVSLTNGSSGSKTNATIFRGASDLDATGQGFATVTPGTTGSNTSTLHISYIDSPATTSSRTYELRIKCNAGTAVFNSQGGTAVIILEELR